MATTNGDVIVAPDDNDAGDQDSSLGDETASSTASLRSSILDYRHENGRTYHRFKDGKYNLPNDERENERLDLQHHLFLRTFDNKLGLAPPNLPGSNVERVLDVGTGTGIWAIDFADDHPEAELTSVPANVEFQIDDIDEEWNYSAPFTYIHSRMMNMSIQNWEDYLRKIFDNLTPGGYVELQDGDAVMESDDGTLTKEHALSKWCNLLREASDKLGRPCIPTKGLRNIMDKVGFTSIVETRQKYKELGAWNNENTRLEVNVLLADVRKELNDPNIHAYWPICSVYGRKPEV
ncbi:S-adenosyl-L-methionine-dependent methyltransferase [Fusarium oxysporum f. sp. albedinis]|nr:S-adenosyl-L-methionine-dependent methyltransferase [Fusarium oxysporum f. sp. albedinis]